MTQELDEDKVEETQEEQTEESVNDEVDEYEAQAVEMGWKPEEQFTGDKDLWVPAKEFVQRAPLYKALHKVNRENKKMKEMLLESKKMYERVENTAKEKAMKELQAQMQEASDRGDVKAAIEAHSEMQKLEKKEETSGSGNPVFDSWVEENQWYQEDEDLQLYAIGVGSKERAKIDKPDQDLTAEDLATIYDQVAKKVKDKFPEKFGNQRRSKPASVADSTTRSNKEVSAKKRNYSFKDLSEDERAVAKNFLRMNVYKSEEEYMKHYVDAYGPPKNQ